MIVLTTVILSFAAKLDMQPKRVYGLPKEGNHVKIKDSFLYVDSLKLHLYTIPKVRDLHTVAKTVIGKWAKMYTTIKIEESGNDGAKFVLCEGLFTTWLGCVTLTSENQL